jgi:hypothetical protein
MVVSFIDGGPRENHVLSQVIDTLYHIMLYTSPWSRFELTTSVVIDTDCRDSCESNYHTITATAAPDPHWKWNEYSNVLEFEMKIWIHVPQHKGTMHTTLDKNNVCPCYIVYIKPLNRNESGGFGALKSDSTHHFFRNACTKSGSLRFSQFSGCW